MAEETGKRDAMVGAFVLLGLVAALVMVVLVGVEQGVFQSRYRLRAVFGSVSGLRAGAPVFVAGVNVGSVDSLQFVSHEGVGTPVSETEEEAGFTSRVGEVQVLFSVEDRFSPQIRRDSVATIAPVGLLGDKSVEISVGSSSEPELAAGELLRSQDPVSIGEVVNQVQPIASKVDKILADISVLTGTLSGEGQPVQKTVQNLSSILEKIDEGQGTLGKLVTSREMAEEFGRSIENIDQLVTQARVAIEEIRSATRELPPTMAAARRTADDIAALSSALRKSSPQLPQIVADIARIAQNLRQSSEGLPGLTVQAQQGVRKANKVFDAAAGSIFLRGSVNQSVERAPAALGRMDRTLSSPDGRGDAPTR